MKRMNLKTEHNCRQGWSLIEMSLMIALLGGFTLVAASVLTLLMQLDTGIATASAFELTAERLEDQLREDARSTVQSEATDDGVNLTTRQGQTIQYRISEGKVQRHINGDRHHSEETFVFVESSVRLIASEEMVEITIRKVSSSGEKNRASLLGTPEGTSVRILVPLGRSLRFAASSDSSGEEI